MSVSEQADARKQAVAEHVLERLLPSLSQDMILGIGTGSTTNFFIDALAEHKSRFAACVVSSKASEARLSQHDIPITDLREVVSVPFYVDGADECDPDFSLIKGGGAALTREKIIASAADRFICIMDESKYVEQLGAFALPVEVIPMASALIARKLDALGGRSVLREGCTTDNGNHILDVHDLRISNPFELETQINNLAGVVTCGLFAINAADEVFMGTRSGVEALKRKHQ